MDVYFKKISRVFPYRSAKVEKPGLVLKEPKDLRERVKLNLGEEFGKLGGNKFLIEFDSSVSVLFNDGNIVIGSGVIEEEW